MAFPGKPNKHRGIMTTISTIKVSLLPSKAGSQPWASYQIRKIAGCACAGNAGNVFPRRRFQRKPLVSDPGMHHGTCVTHVPWCMSGSLTRGDGENVPGIPGACAPAILHIWQEAHCYPYCQTSDIHSYGVYTASFTSGILRYNIDLKRVLSSMCLLSVVIISDEINAPGYIWHITNDRFWTPMQHSQTLKCID